MSPLVTVILVLASAGVAAAPLVRRSRRRRTPTHRPVPAVGWTAQSPTPTSDVDAGTPPRDLQPVQPARQPSSASVIAGALIDSGGGQGRIYELVDDPDRVLKEFIAPIPTAIGNFDTVINARDLVARDLSGLPITLCWPERAVTEGDLLLGYVMRRIDSQFYFTWSRGLWSKRRPRDLQYAIPRQSAFKPPFEVKPDAMLDLVRLIAHFLHAMHCHDLVYGDVSWSNFIFALDPVRLCVLDFDSTRRLGTDVFTAQPPLDTIDWNDPEVSKATVATLDSDRYKFALLAYRMLVAKDLDSRVDSDAVAAAATELPRPDLQDLWRRAAGPWGTRPQLAEWLRALA